MPHRLLSAVPRANGEEPTTARLDWGADTCCAACRKTGFQEENFRSSCAIVTVEVADVQYDTEPRIYTRTPTQSDILVDRIQFMRTQEDASSIPICLSIYLSAICPSRSTSWCPSNSPCPAMYLAIYLALSTCVCSSRRSKHSVEDWHKHRRWSNRAHNPAEGSSSFPPSLQKKRRKRHSGVCFQRREDELRNAYPEKKRIFRTEKRKEEKSSLSLSLSVYIDDFFSSQPLHAFARSLSFLSATISQLPLNELLLFSAAHSFFFRVSMPLLGSVGRTFVFSVFSTSGEIIFGKLLRPNNSKLSG